MPIYLRKMEDGTVAAFGDLESLSPYAGKYDMEITEQQWRDCLTGAHIENGQIVLGRDTDGLAKIVRNTRNGLLEKYCDTVTPLRWNAMDEAKRVEWVEYRQALLDIPQTEGFPWDGKNVPWPDKPE